MKTTLPHLLMKPLPLLLALFAVSCASKTPPVVKVEPTPGRHLSRAESDRVRLSETIKAYPLGRYADPNRRGVMHEAHTIYRVKTTPKWNLAGRERTSTPATPTTARAELSPNELLVELNRQREATKFVMQSGQTVSGKLTDLATLFQQNQRTLAEQNADIRTELKATRKRLETLERKVAEPPAPAPGASPLSDDAPW